jgi:hypothetical protein
MREQITDLNARSWRIPSVVLRIALSLVISAITLALLVPAIHAQGWVLRGWMIWLVILGSLALGIGPGLRNRFRKDL